MPSGSQGSAQFCRFPADPLGINSWGWFTDKVVLPFNRMEDDQKCLRRPTAGPCWGPRPWPASTQSFLSSSTICAVGVELLKVSSPSTVIRVRLDGRCRRASRRRCSRPLRRHPALHNILAAHRRSVHTTVRPASLAPTVFAEAAARRTLAADAAVTCASPASALQETCECSAIALKTVVFVMHSCVEETCAPHPAAQRNMCDRHRALR